MSDKLIFFNKEGDYLNTIYNPLTGRYEADLIFHENSSDTFKTLGIYTFEKKKGFTFEAGSDLGLEKFQLFNEHDFNFSGSSYNCEFVDSIQPTNYDSNFYSKWIYGKDFDTKFPIGSKISFSTPFVEFVDLDNVYTVLSVKRGAILIISNLNNRDFYDAYSQIIEDSNSYIGVTITGRNIIGIKGYKTSSNPNNISLWSEPTFNDKLGVNKKLNVINGSNQGMYTIKNIGLSDSTYDHFYIDSNQVSNNIVVEVHMKNNLPIVYSGSVNFATDGRINFHNGVPSVIKPGYKVKFTSTNNTDYYIVNDIISFDDTIMSSRLYQVGFQVFHNGDIYECIEEHNYRLGDEYTLPNESTMWTNVPTHINVSGNINNELINNCDVYLYNELYTFEQDLLDTPEATMGVFEYKHRDELNNLNISVDYKQDTKRLEFSLMYPDSYADIIIKTNDNIITNHEVIYERNIEVFEKLATSLDNNISEQFNKEITFERLDEYGFKIRINGMSYEQEIRELYVGGELNQRRTIDKSLREFVQKNYVQLLLLGINIKLKNTKDNTSYYDTIIISTVYPNVPLVYEVEVGDNGFYYIRHSSIIFNNIEQILSLNFNGVEYEQQRVMNNLDVDISETLIEWMDKYYSILYSYGIFITRNGNTLHINKLNSDVEFYYDVKVSRSLMPNENDYIIKKYDRGNEGTLITSNSIKLIDSIKSFLENDSFSTGMIVTINNSKYPFINQQYNIVYVDDETINLSYQGPFWGEDDEVCIESPFEITAFSDGFESNLCEFPAGEGGEFDDLEFSDAFTTINPTNENVEIIQGDIEQGSNVKDIIFVNKNDTMYLLTDNLHIMDSTGINIVSTINLGVDSGKYDRLNVSNNRLVLYGENDIKLIDLDTNMIIDNHVSNESISKLITFNDDLIFIDTIGDIVKITQSGTISRIDGNNIVDIILIDGTNKLYAYNDDTFYLINASNFNDAILETSPISIDSIAVYNPGRDVINFESGGSLWELSGIEFNDVGKLINTDIIFYDSVNYAISYIEDGELYILDDSTYSNKYAIDLNNSINYNIVVSPYDGNYYLYPQGNGSFMVINIHKNEVVYQGGGDKILNIVYNSNYMNMVGINTANYIFGIKSNVDYNIDITYSRDIEDNGHGTLSPDYSKPVYLWLKVNDYVRYPRENYTGDAKVEYVWKWEDDNIEDIFLFDFSGEQLETTGIYKYVGDKPLGEIRLNRAPNRDLNRVSDPRYQQTVFNQLTHVLDHNNSGNVDYLAKPMETFIGFKSNLEGVISNKLNLIKRENINYNFISDTSGHHIFFDTIQENNEFFGRIQICNYSNRSFITDDNNNPTGLKAGQLIKLKVKDNFSKYNNYLSKNNGLRFRIKEVDNKTIILEYIESELFEEISIVEHNSTITTLDVTIEVIDDIIATFNITGQTEIEDIRYKVELGNSGKLINSEDVYIFKEYDINEKGIDWTYLNKKRKEMLMVKHDIFSYVGSYKAIINAINYFGYNDLELYEYYRNINFSSDEYGRLTKVEIPDIFNSSIKGWSEHDFIKQTFPNINYEITNLFNLTYRITDKEGNNIQMYSIDEVLIKLQGLKRWLQKNVVPITHELFDITGRSDSPHTTSIVHKNVYCQNFDIEQEMSPINVKLTEAYLMPVNSGSTVYNIKVEFDTKDDRDDIFYELKIRTYKTYNEWEPFKIYKKGERVSYYQQIYESNIDNNRVNDPRKYLELNSFNLSTNYEPFHKTFHKGKMYQWLGNTPSMINYIDSNGIEIYHLESTVPIPGYDVRWKDITEWIPVEYECVQTVQEFKNDLNPSNITVDTNIDPFIVVEVQSDNGYGMVWTTKKNYELRSAKDLSNAVTIIESEPLPERMEDPIPDSPLVEIPSISCDIPNNGFAIEEMESCVLSGLNGFATETVYNCTIPTDGFATETVYNCTIPTDGFATESIEPDVCSFVSEIVSSAVSERIAYANSQPNSDSIGAKYQQRVYGFKNYEGGNGMCKIGNSSLNANYPMVIIYSDKPSLLESTRIYNTASSIVPDMSSIISRMANTVGYYDSSTGIPNIVPGGGGNLVIGGGNTNSNEYYDSVGIGGGQDNYAHWAKVWITCHQTRVAVAVDSNGYIIARSRCGNLI